MIPTILAWILVALIILAAYPWSSWLLARTANFDRLLAILLTLALSLGALTLLMFWELMLGISFSLWGVTLPYFALMLPGLWLWWRNRSVGTSHVLPFSNTLNTPFYRFSLGLLVIIGAAVLLNAVYWPFYRDDTIGIYQRYGLLMYQTSTLVPFAGRDDAFYQAYPMHLPLAYTYSYLSSGWVNEYLAKTLSALLSLACLPAVYVLGRLLYSSLAGALAALLLALMPTFARWASSGYVDLPMAFFYIMTAIFAWRLWESSNKMDALLSGLMIGLAAWTKNAAFVGLGCFCLWLGYCWLNRRISIRHILLSLGVCAAVAAPWYMRNLLEAGLVIPPTAWTDQAEANLSNLLVLITQPVNFALSGWLILIAVIGTVVEMIRQRQLDPQSVLLLVWIIPFFIFWWLFASYDPRFVLLFLPLLAVLAGGWLARVWGLLPVYWQRRLALPLTIVAFSLTLYVTWLSVEYKDELLRDPFMSDAAKHEIVLGDR